MSTTDCSPNLILQLKAEIADLKQQLEDKIITMENSTREEPKFLDEDK